MGALRPVRPTAIKAMSGNGACVPQRGLAGRARFRPRHGCMKDSRWGCEACAKTEAGLIASGALQGL